MWHLSGHVAEKFNSLFTLLGRMNVFFHSANSQKLHSNSDLGRIKPRTRAFVKRWLDFFPDCVDQVLLTGCSLARYSNTFTFSLPPADRGFSPPASWLLRFRCYRSGPVIYSWIQTCFTPFVPARCCCWRVLFLKVVTPLRSRVLPPPQRWTRPTQHQRQRVKVFIHSFILIFYNHF